MGRGQDVPLCQEAAPADGVTVRVVLQPHVPRPGVRGADLATEDVVWPSLWPSLRHCRGPGLATSASRVRVGRLEMAWRSIIFPKYCHLPHSLHFLVQNCQVILQSRDTHRNGSPLLRLPPRLVMTSLSSTNIAKLASFPRIRNSFLPRLKAGQCSQRSCHYASQFEMMPQSYFQDEISLFQNYSGLCPEFLQYFWGFYWYLWALIESSW